MGPTDTRQSEGLSGFASTPAAEARPLKICIAGASALLICLLGGIAQTESATRTPKLLAGVYCVNHRPGLDTFAGKPLPNGDLAFGLSLWYPNGHHFGLFGTAVRRGDHWEYSNDLNAPDPADRCRARIEVQADGTPLLVGDPVAQCRAHGGVRTEFTSVQFPRSAYEGRVTTELSSPETFINSGKCAR